MQRDIIINTTSRITRVAIIEDNLLKEVHIERPSKQILEGNIYKGKVVRVLCGMQAAFVDIGLEKNGFLYAADALCSVPSNTLNPLTPLPDIREILYEGQELLVKVVKDAIGNKGVRLSTEITLASHYLVFIPHGMKNCISSQITDEHKRAQLSDIVQQLTDETGSFIVRTAATHATENCLREDAKFLKTQWRCIQEKAAKAKPKSVVFQNIPLSARLIRDFVCSNINHIVVDNKQEFLQLQQFIGYFFPHHANILHFNPSTTLFDDYGIEHDISQALQKCVELDCGGYLIIEQTQSMVTIDVNSGSYVGTQDLEQTVFHTNLDAAKVVAEQLRLRNLGGMILIDFINMSREEHRQAVLDCLRNELAKDRVRSSVCGFTSLGLVEMTRKCTRESLAHMICEPCEHCRGLGVRKCFENIGCDIYHQLCKKHDKRSSYILYVSIQLNDYLEKHCQGQQLWQKLLETSGQKIVKKCKYHFSSAQFELIAY